jgi:hypothetical protein
MIPGIQKRRVNNRFHRVGSPQSVNIPTATGGNMTARIYKITFGVPFFIFFVLLSSF